MNTERRIQRYSSSERVNHWLVAIGFVLVALSGLALFHPALFWLSNLFGGGAWTRILHPFIGVAMVAAFVSMLLRVWPDNKIEAHDKRWLKHWRDIASNREGKTPEAGRYNGGQKLVFWLTVVCVATLLVTGVVFWRPWFADSFPVTLVRLAALLHAFAATVMIIGIIVHVYAAIWIKGSIGAMMHGTVSARWAKRHHAAWYRQVSK